MIFSYDFICRDSWYAFLAVFRLIDAMLSRCCCLPRCYLRMRERAMLRHMRAAADTRFHAPPAMLVTTRQMSCHMPGADSIRCRCWCHATRRVAILMPLPPARRYATPPPFLRRFRHMLMPPLLPWCCRFAADVLLMLIMLFSRHCQMMIRRCRYLFRWLFSWWYYAYFDIIFAFFWWLSIRLLLADTLLLRCCRWFYIFRHYFSLLLSAPLLFRLFFFSLIAAIWFHIAFSLYFISCWFAAISFSPCWFFSDAMILFRFFDTLLMPSPSLRWCWLLLMFSEADDFLSDCFDDYLLSLIFRFSLITPWWCFVDALFRCHDISFSIDIFSSLMSFRFLLISDFLLSPLPLLLHFYFIATISSLMMFAAVILLQPHILIDYAWPPFRLLAALPFIFLFSFAMLSFFVAAAYVAYYFAEAILMPSLYAFFIFIFTWFFAFAYFDFAACLFSLFSAASIAIASPIDDIFDSCMPYMLFRYWWLMLMPFFADIIFRYAITIIFIAIIILFRFISSFADIISWLPFSLPLLSSLPLLFSFAIFIFIYIYISSFICHAFRMLLRWLRHAGLCHCCFTPFSLIIDIFALLSCRFTPDAALFSIFAFFFFTLFSAMPFDMRCRFASSPLLFSAPLASLAAADAAAARCLCCAACRHALLMLQRFIAADGASLILIDIFISFAFSILLILYADVFSCRFSRSRECCWLSRFASHAPAPMPPLCAFADAQSAVCAIRCCYARLRAIAMLTLRCYVFAAMPCVAAMMLCWFFSHFLSSLADIFAYLRYSALSSPPLMPLPRYAFRFRLLLFIAFRSFFIHWYFAFIIFASLRWLLRHIAAADFYCWLILMILLPPALIDLFMPRYAMHFRHFDISFSLIISYYASIISICFRWCHLLDAAAFIFFRFRCFSLILMLPFFHIDILLSFIDAFAFVISRFAYFFAAADASLHAFDFSIFAAMLIFDALRLLFYLDWLFSLLFFFFFFFFFFFLQRIAIAMMPDADAISAMLSAMPRFIACAIFDYALLPLPRCLFDAASPCLLWCWLASCWLPFRICRHSLIFLADADARCHIFFMPLFASLMLFFFFLLIRCCHYFSSMLFRRHATLFLSFSAAIWFSLSFRLLFADSRWFIFRCRWFFADVMLIFAADYAFFFADAYFWFWCHAH